MEKINIVELLKDCPTGIELDCTIYDECILDSILEGETYPIKIRTPEGAMHLTKYGSMSYSEHAKCVIFPKGKTTWEGFVPPCKFKDGDIVFYNDTIAIFKEWGDETLFRTYVTKYLCCDSMIDIGTPLFGKSVRREIRFATEEEKEKLFQAIKDNGYKWNAETKTLYKLIESKFHEGDWITNGDYTWKVISVDNFDYTLQNQLGEYVEDTIDHVNKAFHLWTIKDAKEGDVLTTDLVHFIFKSQDDRDCYMHCNYSVVSDNFSTSDTAIVDSMYVHPTTKEQSDILFQKIKETGYKWNKEIKALKSLIEPKFKVGDKIKRIKTGNIYEISKIVPNYYIAKYLGSDIMISFNDHDEYELVPNKFDITTLKRFEKVLVRGDVGQKWTHDFFGFMDKDKGCPFVCVGHYVIQCIPYEGNEHLLGKTDDCDEYYKTWE